MRIGVAMGNNSDVYPNRTQDVIIQCRETLGNDVQLMADANGGYTDFETAKEIALLMKEYNYQWFEEPFPWWMYDLTKQLTDLDIINIALGENEYRMIDGWQYMINISATHYCQPDIGYAGGLTNVMKIIQWAQDRDMYMHNTKRCIDGVRKNSIGSCIIDLHSPSPTLDVIYTMHFYSIAMKNYDNFDKYMEFESDDGIPPKNGYIFEPAIEINKNGQLSLPKGSGWGVNLKQSVYDSKTASKTFNV